MKSVVDKDYEELEIKDDYMFCKVFTDNPRLTKRLAEIITGRKIREIQGLVKQKVVDVVRENEVFDLMFSLRMTGTRNMILRCRQVCMKKYLRGQDTISH